jgi:hypothetical protein
MQFGFGIRGQEGGAINARLYYYYEAEVNLLFAKAGTLV